MAVGLMTIPLAPQRAWALDFELARVDGGGFVHYAQLPATPTLINFWRADCPPCVTELPVLVDLIPRYGLRLITVALQKPAETRAFWPQVPGSPDQHLALHGPVDAQAFLRRFGNKKGALPYSVLLHANGLICQSRLGVIDAAWLKQAMQACSMH